MNPDDYLMLSGIQHFAFCRRQWALIHIEQVWKENVLTFGGRQMHRNADDPFFTESRGDVLLSRSVPLVSHTLRVYGIADVVEYHRSDTGVAIAGREGSWTVVPVEYKAGRRKPDDRDEVQLCAQAICLEEMYRTRIERGYLYYGKTRRRTEVILDDELRNRVAELVAGMYALYDAGITPPAELLPHCKNCSLVDLCMPAVSSRRRSVDRYLTVCIGKDET
ncbi:MULTISPECIES: CRISPR-associated protein Cas4 [unclassified Methanoculleus]|jgi:CRISPR-associated exonuclease Cas4|uniref:CRISPR-associated exonuclease Cas4 n=1 Tax=Methanoculleus palmolei TaxID=72612 RepID=A0ABD8A990_9EURY|nr:CRISPR-associated protein Cas4 [Methanoculleus sp. UBA377]MDD2472428.1 CRISPR-associated protein Cas4 [Methanoculleus sp.]WOX56080.1 CRISPR-associated protein Cas4 [Methanoculleus palmolei]